MPTTSTPLQERDGPGVASSTGPSGAAVISTTTLPGRGVRCHAGHGLA